MVGRYQVCGALGSFLYSYEYPLECQTSETKHLYTDHCSGSLDSMRDLSLPALAYQYHRMSSHTRSVLAIVWSSRWSCGIPIIRPSYRGMRDLDADVHLSSEPQSTLTPTMPSDYAYIHALPHHLLPYILLHYHCRLATTRLANFC